jgi:hypothetical protein
MKSAYVTKIEEHKSKAGSVFGCMEKIESSRYKTKTEYLRQLIAYLLGLSNLQVEFPKVIVIDKNVDYVCRVFLEFCISDHGIIEDPRIVAHHEAFSNRDFKANLCHELGHLIYHSRKINKPLDSFLNMLRNEIMADLEGLRLFIRSGEKKYKYSSLLSKNFSALVKKMYFLKDRRTQYMCIKAFLINIFRVFVFMWSIIFNRGSLA